MAVPRGWGVTAAHHSRGRVSVSDVDLDDLAAGVPRGDLLGLSVLVGEDGDVGLFDGFGGAGAVGAELTHGLVVDRRDAAACGVAAALVVHVVAEVVVEGAAGVLVKAVLSLVVAVAEVVPVTGFAELVPQRLVG